MDSLRPRHWTDAPRFREGGVTIPRLWLTIALSLLIHGAALWLWFPRTPLLTPGADSPDAASAPLTLKLVAPRPVQPKPAPPVPEAPPPTVAKAKEPPPRPPRKRPPPASPVIVIETPRPAVTLPPPAPPEVAVTPPSPVLPPKVPPVAATPPPLQSDLSAYIASRRKARGEAGESLTPAQEEIARRDRIVAANLASLQAPAVGNVPKNGGGTFQVQFLGYEDAEFTFYGWNKDIRRRLYQRIDVRKGSHPNIRVAVIRKIIAIIREHETADFRWESKLLGRDLMLSARLSDNADLEAFMMKEFFGASQQPR